MPFKKTGDVSKDYTEISNNSVKDEKRRVEPKNEANLKLVPSKDDKKDSPNGQKD